jgi:hypothetical protein
MANRDLRVLIALSAIAFSALYVVCDVIELVRILLGRHADPRLECDEHVFAPHFSRGSQEKTKEHNANPLKFCSP